MQNNNNATASAQPQPSIPIVVQGATGNPHLAAVAKAKHVKIPVLTFVGYWGQIVGNHNSTSTFDEQFSDLVAQQQPGYNPAYKFLPPSLAVNISAGPAGDAALSSVEAAVPGLMLAGYDTADLQPPELESLKQQANAVVEAAYGFLGHVESLKRTWRFSPFAYVQTLEKVAVGDISPDDMRCPCCWYGFGESHEEDPAFKWEVEGGLFFNEGLRNVQEGFYEMPFRVDQWNNDPVRTPCGHLFGHDCLVKALGENGTLCPLCRQELDPMKGRP